MKIHDHWLLYGKLRRKGEKYPGFGSLELFLEWRTEKLIFPVFNHVFAKGLEE